MAKMSPISYEKKATVRHKAGVTLIFCAHAITGFGESGVPIGTSPCQSEQHCPAHASRCEVR